MTAGEMPDIEMTVTDDGLDLSDIDATPMLLRQFTWDIMPCSQVAEMLPELGLTTGTEEGMRLDHVESHRRVATAYPLEDVLQKFAEIISVVVTKAMINRAGVELGDDEVKYAEQNEEIILCASRAILAHFLASGILEYPAPMIFLAGDERV